MKQKAQLLIGILLVLQFSSCRNDTGSKAVSDSEKIDNHGVNIDYHDSSVGDTVLLFIHGWGINQTYWANQVSYFAKDYRMITVDLPGFGKSGKNRTTWTVEDYAKDIDAVLTQLDLKNVILIGHSMSGSIITETAITYPSRIIAVVGVDNLKDIGIIMTPQLEKEWAGFYGDARKNFKKTVSDGIQNLFSPSTDSLIQKRVTEDILNSDTTIAVNCLENLDKYPFVGKLKSLNKVFYLINSDYKATDTLAFQKNGIEYDLLNIGPTGHYPMLEKPDDFNLLLEKVIEKIRMKQRIK